jgi:hypothetical protein
MHINWKARTEKPPYLPTAPDLVTSIMFHRARQDKYMQQRANRKDALLEQSKQQAKKNIEAEKRKQANSNKKETPEQYKARKELQAQRIVKKETPEEYKARKELQAQRIVKKETPEEYKARIDYIKKKEEVELQAETYRLYNKAEKQHYERVLGCCSEISLIYYYEVERPPLI